MMRKSLALAALILLAAPLHAQITLPYTFSPGTTALSAEVNANFQELADKALNKTGDTLTGTLTVSADVTVDGVDLSDFLSPSGYVIANTAGAAGTPSFTRTSDTTTGLYFPAASQIALSLAGTQRLLLNSSGLTVFGTNIIDSTGKIPAISSTYFGALSGENLTSLNASNISSGTVDDDRLSADIAELSVANSWGATQTFGTAAATSITTTNLRIGTSTTSGWVLTADASGNGTWQSPGVATGAVPSGLIAIFDAACPSTWTRVSAFDNKFIRGGASYSAAAGGSDSHTHTVDPASTTSSSENAHSHTTDTQGAHTHTTDIASTTSSSEGSHDHGVASVAVSTNGSHTHTGTTDNGGDHTHTVSDSDFVQGGGAVGAVSGQTTSSSGDHNHTFTTASGGDHNHSLSGWTDLGGTHTHTVNPVATASDSQGGHSHTTSTQAAHTHTTDIASTSTSSGANVPAYAQVIFCKKD